MKTYTSPQVLIFDEAISNLDRQSAEHFVQTINHLKGKKGGGG